MGTREVGVILHEAYAAHEALLGLMLPNLVSKCQEPGVSTATVSARGQGC